MPRLARQKRAKRKRDPAGESCAQSSRCTARAREALQATLELAPKKSGSTNCRPRARARRARKGRGGERRKKRKKHKGPSPGTLR
eukprot:4339814-Pyramimonas_sp.AAC.1